MLSADEGFVLVIGVDVGSELRRGVSVVRLVSLVVGSVGVIRLVRVAWLGSLLTGFSTVARGNGGVSNDFNSNDSRDV